MARTMTEQNTGIYRTVVSTEFLEDSEEFYWDYRYGQERTKVLRYKAGDVVVEIFGPYITNAQNQNYSRIKTHRREETDELAYRREDFAYMSDDMWARSNYSTRKKENWVKIANQVTEYQKLTPVLALQASGSLTMELDWVKY